MSIEPRFNQAQVAVTLSDTELKQDEDENQLRVEDYIT